MKKRTPRLRFKEFTEPWDLVRLESISTHIKRTSDDVLENILTISAGRGFLEQKERFSQVIAGNSVSKYTLLFEDEFSYNRGNSKKYTYGCIYRLKEYKQALVPNVYISFKINNQIPTFYEYLFRKKYLDKQLRQLISSSARMDGLLNINKTEFFKVKVPLPNIAEQEKIAYLFSLIDKKVELQSEKVEYLKEYKKGIIQKIFSQQLKFKDINGEDYPMWKNSSLGKLIKIKSNRNKNCEVDLVLSVSNTKGFIRQSDQFEDRVIASSDISNYKIVEKHDFAFNPARINVGSIARLKLYDTGIISPMYTCFKCLDTLNSSYLEYFLMTYSFDVEMKKRLEGSVRQTLSADALSEIAIELPCIEEQEKISEFLNKISEKLYKEQEKLDYLNEYKKGLLQQMFV